MTTTTIQVHVEPDHLALTLGERTAIEVEIFNGSSIVDEFRVDLLGPWTDPIRPEWVTIRPVSLALFPNSSGAVLLTLDVPAASQLLAGQHVLGLRVRSLTDPNAAYVAELPLTVNSQPIVAMHLDPQTANGGSSSATSIVVRNLGNVPVNLWLQTADPANAIKAELGQLDIPLAPDEEATVPVTLNARRPLIGTGVARPYSVIAEVEDRAGDVGAEAQPFVEQARAEGVFQQSARINGRVLTTLGMLLPVIAILVAAWILRPQTEPEILSGPLSFGVGGVVERVEVRPQQFILAGDRISTMRAIEPELALNEAQLALRRAIVDLEGLKTQHLADQAQIALDEDAVDPAPDPAFIETLVQELQRAVESALAVSSTALTGLSGALGEYCGTVEERPTECDTQPVPLPSAFIAQLVDQAATNPAARDVVDANANYRSSTSTLQTVQALLQDAEARYEAAGGDPETVPVANPGTTDGTEIDPLVAAQDEQAATEYELSLLEQQALIAEAQLACRAALENVGRTVLRAPVDVLIVDVLVTPGAEVEGDAPIVIVERTDGRVFTPPAGLRAPDSQDLPASSCPGTIDELRALDSGQAAATSGTQKSTQSE